MGFLKTTAGVAAGLLVTVGGCTAWVWHKATGHMPDDMTASEKVGQAARESVVDAASGVIGSPEELRAGTARIIKGTKERIGAIVDGAKDAGVEIPKFPSIGTVGQDASPVVPQVPATPRVQLPTETDLKRSLKAACEKTDPKARERSAGVRMQTVQEFEADCMANGSPVPAAASGPGG